MFSKRVIALVGEERSQLFAWTLYDLVMVLSDQQLATGIAILVAAISGLRGNGKEGSITVYHFNAATDLAWFSANTHLLTLLVVASSQQTTKPSPKNNKSKKPPYTTYNHAKFATLIPKSLRIFLMLSLAALLLYCTYRLGYSGLYDEFRCPMQCTNPKDSGGEPKAWMIADFVLILHEYPLAICQIISPIMVFWHTHLRHYVVDMKAQALIRQLPPTKYDWRSRLRRFFWPGIFYL